MANEVDSESEKVVPLLWMFGYHYPSGKCIQISYRGCEKVLFEAVFAADLKVPKLLTGCWQEATLVSLPLIVEYRLAVIGNCEKNDCTSWISLTT